MSKVIETLNKEYGVVELRVFPDNASTTQPEMGMLISLPFEALLEYCGGNLDFARILYRALWDNGCRTIEDYTHYKTNGALSRIQQAIRSAHRTEGIRLLNFVVEYTNNGGSS